MTSGMRVSLRGFAACSMAIGLVACGGTHGQPLAKKSTPPPSTLASTLPPSTTTTASELVPALQTHNPSVTVAPSSHLSKGQVVTVRVMGFGIGGKVWLSECAEAMDANSDGCGQGLPEQTLLVTDSTGSGSATFAVQASASAKANDFATNALQTCANDCVLVATLGGGYGFAFASLHFTTSG